MLVDLNSVRLFVQIYHGLVGLYKFRASVECTVSIMNSLDVAGVSSLLREHGFPEETISSLYGM